VLAGRPNIGVEVVAVEVLAESGIKTSLPFGVEIEVGVKVLEHLAVVLTAGNDRAEHRREGVPRMPSQSAQVPYSWVSLIRTSPTSNQPAQIGDMGGMSFLIGVVQDGKANVL
jgi:hypothetical protein